MGHSQTARSQDYLAHSANSIGVPHRLRDHLCSVAALAKQHADGCRWADEAALAGLLHDLGKYGDRFQARLQGKDSGLDHWSQGAWLALVEHKAVAAALAIQGHHIGLQYLSKDALCGLELRKLAQNHPLQLDLSHVDLNDLKVRLIADGLTPQAPENTLCGKALDSRLDRMLDVRMLFSALVDADFLDTEAHFNANENGKQYRQMGPELDADKALAVLLNHVEDLQRSTRAAGAVGQVRASLQQACLHAAEKATGLFTLTAPTGSGKTVAMLAFALAHARKHGLRRVVIVIPYLSIIEQTAEIYRDIFGRRFGDEYVLEHHSLAGSGAEQNRTDNEGNRTEDPERRRRLLAENWDAPLIVTTSVQMLESVFSNRPSACRKLHRLARSVILFDEVQTLPTSLAVPTLAALSHLAHTYGSSVVFATATQPAFSHLHETVRKHCVEGWRPREIVPEPAKLFTRLLRVDVNWGEPERTLSWKAIAEQLVHHPQALCIVNLKRHAKELWELLQENDALHLSTNLCPGHRRDVLATVRQLLKDQNPVRLIATQCIEAGVDVDFPAVYRAYAPLDAIIQAAGRCNREGMRTKLGQVYVFLPEEERYPPGGGYEQAAQVTKMLFKREGRTRMALDDVDFITGYYRELYGIAGINQHPKTRALLKYITAGAFPEIAREYRLIEQDTINIVVPYDPYFDEYQRLCELAGKSGLTRDWIKHARPLTVGWFRPKSDDPIWDSLLPVQQFRHGRRDTQEDWFIYAVKEHYHGTLGLSPPGALNSWIA